MTNEPVCEIDYETRSACNLKRHGTYRYSVDPTTEILCLIWRLPHWVPGRTALWHPAFLDLPEHFEEDAILELLEWIEEGGLVEAHSVFFEWCIWTNIQHARHGWPLIPFEQWRCSAAKAAAHSLPRGLEDAAIALKLPIRKDMEGSKVMKKMSKPRKSLKKERLQWAKDGITPPKLLWHESPELLARLIEYCRLDVLSEEGLSHALPDLNEQETQVFLMDLRMNAKGFQLDKDAVKVAHRLIFREGVLLNQELRTLTKGQVKKATQRPKMLAWFNEQGLDIDNTQKATIDGLLTSGFEFEPTLRRGLELVRELGRSSTAKYKAMRDWAARDGRVRGGLLYHGASTGRWSGKGVQPHNFPKGTFKNVDMGDLWATLIEGHRPSIQQKYTGVLEALSNALRGVITASRGCQLYVADYASIEARVLLWLANDQDALDIFRQGLDIYCDMAASIYGYPCNKDDHPTERSMGKIAVLGLGYQMGASKFLDTCASFGIVITEAFSKQVVDAYRTKFWRVKELWADQEKAAIQAVETRKTVFCSYVKWFVSGRFLYCQLPSGRRLAYPYPEVKLKTLPWGGSAPSLTFMGVDTFSHKWKRLTVYGGLIVENLVQAISRDIMAEAMLRVEAGGEYQILLSIHDEILAEALEGTGDVHDFEQLMAGVPLWADGCPIEAAGWTGQRYRKG